MKRILSVVSVCFLTMILFVAVQSAHAVLVVNSTAITCSTVTVTGTADTAYVAVNVGSPSGALIESYNPSSAPAFYAPVTDGAFSFTASFAEQAAGTPIYVTVYEAPNAQYFSRTDYLSDFNTPACQLSTPPTPEPTATATPAPLQRLRLTSLCSPDPSAYRVWRVRNGNRYEVAFTWDMYRSSTDQTGAGVAPAAVSGGVGETFFQTITEGGPNTVHIFVNGVQQDVKASNPAQC